MTSDTDRFKEALYNAALEAIDRGWNVIPLSITSKKPLNSWQEYQTRLVTPEEIDEWFTNGAPTSSGDRIEIFNLALITGEISGVIVVDCDNEAAERYARDHGMASPMSVQTTRGRHFYFTHPGGGMRFQNHVGGTTKGWPEIQGFDLRGDGGYVIMPPSIKVDRDGSVVHQYQWQFDGGFDPDDLPDVIWKGTPSEVIEEAGEFTFESLSLSGVRVASLDDGAPIYDQAKARVALLGRRMRDGDGRNNWVTRYAGQQVRRGITGDDLRDLVGQFQDEFFDDPLEPRELEATLRSVQLLDRRKYPDDYDASGERLKANPATKPQQAGLGRLRPIYMGDADRLLATMQDTDWVIEPLVAAGQITQVVGYNGHGKSIFVSAAMAAVASGRDELGPFALGRTRPILYLDFENPASTLLHRIKGWRDQFGDAAQRLAVWSPSIIRPEDGGSMDLMTEEGRRTLTEWCQAVQPEVVVIDTIRSAFVGLEERDNTHWVIANQLAKRLRNVGCAVILVHHRNKPGADGLGREAGSTAQLTDIDTQVFVTQVMRSKQDARARGALLSEDITIHDAAGNEHSPFTYLEARLEPDSRILNVMQISFGKVRVETDLHETHYLGWAERLADGRRYLVSTLSKKQKARHFSSANFTPDQIAQKIMVPTHEIRRWLGLGK